MKKVLCNLLYEVKIPVTHKELGDVPLDLGIFVDMEDAECAGMLSKKILSMDDYDFLAVGDYEVNNEYIPESEMKSPKVVNRLHKDLNHFALNDNFIKNFMNKYGFIALSEILIDCVEEIEARENAETNPSQKG